MNYQHNFYGSGFVNTARFHQLNSEFKLNSWQFGTLGYTWTTLSSGYPSGSYPCLSMCATQLYLTSITPL